MTCLDVSADQTRLVIGHRQGHIVFCELPRGRLLKTLVAGERHDKGLAIVSVNFLQGSVNSVLAVDSKVRARQGPHQVKQFRPDCAHLFGGHVHTRAWHTSTHSSR